MDILTLINKDLLLAAGLGTLVGLERELSGKDPGLRTFALIALGSCAFSLISRQPFIDTGIGDPTRVAAQIVSGIGFLGAGAIFRGSRRVSGLTTAALMWVTAGIGMAVGFDCHDIAISTTVIALVITLALRLVRFLIFMVRRKKGNQAAFEID
jgi:putative Mg2+ transporter-C (MgtC) family protein